MLTLDAAKVKRLRKAKGMTFAAAAEAGGLKSGQVWYLLERGKSPNVTLETLDALARALGVASPCDLTTTKPPAASRKRGTK